MWVLIIQQRNDLPKHEFEQRLWYFQNPLPSACLAKCWDAWKAQLDLFLIVVKAREAMTVRDKILGLLLDVHISSAILTPLYHFRRR